MKTTSFVFALALFLSSSTHAIQLSKMADPVCNDTGKQCGGPLECSTNSCRWGNERKSIRDPNYEIPLV